VNIGASWPGLDEAERRVLAMQNKLHRWAASDPGRVFDDLYNLVWDPAFMAARNLDILTTKPRHPTVPRCVLAGAEYPVL
jgi:hypothetical protein